MLEFINNLSLVLLLGYLGNFVSIIVYVVWYKVITYQESTYKEEDFNRNSSYELFTIFRLFIPFLGAFKVYQYIILYVLIEQELSLKHIHLDCYDILRNVEVKLQNNEDK